MQNNLKIKFATVLHRCKLREFKLRVGMWEIFRYFWFTMLCEGWRKTTLVSQTVGLNKKLLTAFEILFYFLTIIGLQTKLEKVFSRRTPCSFVEKIKPVCTRRVRNCQFFLSYVLGVQTLQQALRARLFVWEEIVSEKRFSSHIVRQLSLTACLSFKTDLFQVW